MAGWQVYLLSYCKCVEKTLVDSVAKQIHHSFFVSLLGRIHGGLRPMGAEAAQAASAEELLSWMQEDPFKQMQREKVKEDLANLKRAKEEIRRMQ